METITGRCYKIWHLFNYQRSGPISRVLYIDENISAQLRTVIEQHGHEVDSVTMGKEGLKLYLAAPCQIVLLNHQLGDMSGIDLCRKLLFEDAEVCIIFLAAIDQHKMVSEALDLGVAQYLIRDDQSIYLDLLPSIVASLLRRAETTHADITDHRRIEQQLLKDQDELELKVTERTRESNESDKRFRDFNEVSSDWYWEFDKDLCYVSILPTTAGEAEYPVSDYIGRSRAEVKPEGIDEAVWQAHLQDLYSQRPFRNFIQPRPLADGSVLWMSVSGKPIFDENGTFMGYRGTASDITEQQRINKELMESLAIQDAILSNIAEGVSMADADGRIIAYNQQFLDINDLPSELLKSGTTYDDLVRFNAKRGHYGSGEEDELVAERLAQIHSSENSISEKVRQDGRIIEIRRQSLPDGGVVITDSDVTERIKTEENLRRQQIIIEKVEQAAKYGHWMWDEVNDKSLHCSEGLAPLRGMTVDEYAALMALPNNESQRVHPDDAAFMHDVWKKMRDKGEHYSAEYRFVHTNGEIRWVREVGSPMDVSDSGKVLTSVGITYDITDAREIENRLRNSEERYRQIADVSSDWVWEMNTDLQFSYFSEGFERITGGSPEFSLGKTRGDICSPDELEKPSMLDHLADLEAHRKFRDFQYAFIDPDGVRRYFSISGAPVFDENNEFEGYRGTASDVTTRVATEAALAKSTEKMQHAIMLVKLGHYVWDGIAKRAISCTEEYARIHGVSVDEYLSFTNSLEALISWIHVDDRNYYLDAIERAMAARKDLELEYRIVARDGRVRYVHEVFDPTYDNQGQLIQTSGAMQDITERKEVEEALKDAERIAAIGNWRWSVDKKQHIFCSEGFSRVLGLAIEDMPASITDPGFGMVPAEDRERLDQVFDEAIEKGQNYEIEYRIIRPDGEIRDILEIGEAVHDSDGRCREIKGTIQDITERKNVEREINAARDEAVQANQAKSAFLSSMSHELRTPLNAILGFSQVLESNRKEPLTAKQKISVAHILKGGEHLLELITQVLDLARIETGRTDFFIEPIDLEEALVDCFSITQALAKSRKINVIDNVSDKGLRSIRADLTRVKQILLNLLSNGVKYNREGGTLTVDAEVTAEEMMHISVTDTGFGIDEKLFQHVFKAFDRLGREALDVEGTGIGLTISKQLVELMHGRIGFISEINKGSTFWIELPLADSNDYADIASAQNDDGLDLDQLISQDNREYRVLHIEDNPTNAQLMVRIFEGLANMQLITAFDAESGLELVKEQPPDLILMDIQLPGMDGIEALTVLKQSNRTRGIPVIAISAAAMKADIERAKDAGFYAYLTKPLDIGKTLETVRNALG